MMTIIITNLSIRTKAKKLKITVELGYFPLQKAQPALQNTSHSEVQLCAATAWLIQAHVCFALVHICRGETALGANYKFSVFQ